MEMTNLGLKYCVLNREMSSWQRCLLRKVPLYMIKGYLGTDRHVLLRDALFTEGMNSLTANFDLNIVLFVETRCPQVSTLVR
jgi:hypothetical protein